MRIAATVLALYLTACASVVDGKAPRVERPALSDRLFCGLSIPGGGAVAQSELDTFIREVVEPRFPQGFTVWRAGGHWRGGTEEVMVLEIIRPMTIRDEEAVGEIADEYRRRFRQEAVLRVMMPARMEFVEE